MKTKILKSVLGLFLGFIFSINAFSQINAIESLGGGSFIANPPTLTLNDSITTTPAFFTYSWNVGGTGRTVSGIADETFLCVEIRPLFSNAVWTYCETVSVPTISNRKPHAAWLLFGVRP